MIWANDEEIRVPTGMVAKLMEATGRSRSCIQKALRGEKPRYRNETYEEIRREAKQNYGGYYLRCNEYGLQSQVPCVVADGLSGKRIAVGK